MPAVSQYQFDWADLAFKTKAPINQLKATFIAAPRDISVKRFRQLVKTYLPKGNIVLGISLESFVNGLENQAQFRMLVLDKVLSDITKINAHSPHKIYTLSYFQLDLPYIIEKLKFNKAAFINGSWYHAFHRRPEFYALIKQQLPYELISPFADEAEAKTYADDYASNNPLSFSRSKLGYTADEMLEVAAETAKRSFAYSEHQMGVAIGHKKMKQGKPTYQLLLTAHNRVVPYETYAMHHGASRELNFSPPNDLNHYDVNHAEVEAIVTAGKQGINLTDTTMFINVLPCPTCARMLTSTGISELIYQEDHTAGYAKQMFELAGKKVRRVA